MHEPWLLLTMNTSKMVYCRDDQDTKSNFFMTDKLYYLSILSVTPSLKILH